MEKKTKKIVKQLRATLCNAGMWVLNLCDPVVINCSRFYSCFHTYDKFMGIFSKGNKS